MATKENGGTVIRSGNEMRRMEEQWGPGIFSQLPFFQLRRIDHA